MKIAYVMSRFPLLSETFILREMIEVENIGYEVALYPLICQDQPIVHDEAKQWIPRARCIPFFSAAILLENLRVFITKPATYISLLIQVIWHNRSSLDFLTKGLFLFPKAVYAAKLMKFDGIEHIHAHYATHPALKAWIIHQLTGITYSITIHSHDIYDCHAMLQPKLRDAVFLAPISEYNIRYLADLLGEWVREKCHVVHCGIDPSKYAPKPRMTGSGDVFQILQIGTMHWKKAQVHLIQTAAILRDRGVPFQLNIIGEGEERQNIEAEIQKYNLNRHVQLLGAKTQDEVVQILPVADCYIQSSVSEGIPVAIMEAMACELPVVSTNITGIPELVLDGKTGILVEPADTQGMADALQSLYENPATRREMGKKGRDWVLREFTLTGNAEKLTALFETVNEMV
jgi:colanic acid/amylovoran biosynthesis glycosyltransferase